MKYNRISKAVLIPLGVAILATSSAPAFAQLEEIVVTARRRAESLQDVPISVQAISGEQIAEQGLIDLASLAPYTPNFNIVQSPGASDLIFMRGVGTYGSGVHFEPSVGQVFNGYFSTRSRLSRTALIDVAQVEVLRGPQGAIIGKNTSLGALNITSNRPTDEFEGAFNIAYNSEASKGVETQAILSGPLSENVRGRLVADYRDVDGWVDNRVTGNSLQSQKDTTIRAMLDWDISDTLTAEFLYQYNDLDRNGKPREVVECFAPGVIPRTRADPATLGFDCQQNASNQTGNLQRASPDGPLYDPGEPFTSRAHIAGVTLNFEFENFNLASLTNFTSYEINDNFSGDLLPTERANIQNTEDFEQIYQEFRATSNSDGDVGWTLGATYFKGELEAYQVFHAAFANTSRNEFQRSDTESLSTFGQIDWDINDQMTLAVGARYTKEDRNGAKAQAQAPLYGTIPNTLDNPATGIGCGPGFRACTNGDGSPVTGSISDSGLSYNLALQYRTDESNMYYVSVATGFKSGGFDLRGAGNPDTFVFPEEESINYEIGGKHTLADGALRVNWSIFNLEVDDLQVSTNDPVLIQQVVGKAQVSSKGLEIDGAWAASDALTLTFTGALLDSTFDQFTSECHAGQTAATGCNGGLFVQDGLTLPQAPEQQLVLGAKYNWALNNGMDLTLGGSYSYLSDYHVTLPRDPVGFQDSISRLDASLVLTGTTASDKRWSVALIGRNLGDELVKNWCNTSGLSGGGVASCSIEQTRYVSLRSTINF
jgi:iron complex outermembrane receptor protein